MAKKYKPKEVNEDKSKKPQSGVVKKEMSIEKYFQLYDPPIHLYTRAALKVEFRGIIKLAKEWAAELEEYTRGE